MLHSGIVKSRGVSAESVEDLCDEISGNPEYASAKVLTINCYQNPKGVKHEFLIMEVYIPERNNVWVRIERAADAESRKKISLLSMSSTFVADDSVSIVSQSALKVFRANSNCI
jgi:hypothetical protein